MEQPAGIIQSDGRYELFTGSKGGAAAGWYRVLIMSDNFQVVDPPESPYWPDYPPGFRPQPLVNERYLYFNKTDLIVEVVPNGSPQAYDLNPKP